MKNKYLQLKEGYAQKNKAKGINIGGEFCAQKKSSFLGGSHGKLVLALIPMGDILELFFSLMSRKKSTRLMLSLRSMFSLMSNENEGLK